VRAECADSLREQPVLSTYKWTLAAVVSFLILCLLAIVDLRRGFLFAEYFLKTPYLVLSPLHPLLLAVGLIGLRTSHRTLKRHETTLKPAILERYTRGLAVVLFGVLVADLFTYRGVAATRAVEAGSLGAGWLGAFGVTGWLKPVALSVSYLLAVWHATFLGVLLAGLALTFMPRYLQPYCARPGFGGTFFGGLFALPQPFCSCCAALITPSLVGRGASVDFSLAFVVGSPMLNLSALILAAALLPTPYAVTRVLAGVILAVLVTYAVSRLAERWDRIGAGRNQRPLNPRVSRWLDLYYRIFDLEGLVRERPLNTPGDLVSAWFFVSGRIALILVPTLWVWSVATAAIVQALPSTFGNNLPSVVSAAIAGTLLMVSTWTEIPVALQMIQAGYTGPAATLLVVLPPVSLPCLMLLAGSLGRYRVVVLLGLAVAVAGIIAGVAFL
jgi:hypothetical protein